MNRRITRLALSFLLFCFLIVFDQFTKQKAVSELMGHESFALWKGVFELTYSENQGAAFGLLQGHQTLFLLVAALVFAAVLYLLLTLPEKGRYWPLVLCLTFIASGAAGNLIDRLSQGYVVDFLYFKLIDFPIFNVADCYVTCATGILFLLLFFGYYSEEEIALMIPGRRKERT